MLIWAWKDKRDSHKGNWSIGSATNKPKRDEVEREPAFFDNIPLGFACQVEWMPVDEEAAASSGVPLFLLVNQALVLDKHKKVKQLNVWAFFYFFIF